MVEGKSGVGPSFRGIVMASFEAFIKVKERTEGYFARLAGDTGGMTYRGIARNFHPNWPGWTIIDFQLTQNPNTSDSQLSQTLKSLDYLNDLVDDFYRPFWNRIGASQLSQDLANIYMDWYIHKPKDAVQTMQSVLNRSFGENLTVDGVPGPRTNAAVLRNDSDRLYNLYRQARINNYQLQFSSSPTFWASWVRRVENNFPSKTTHVIPLVAAGLTFLGLGLWYLSSSKSSEKQ